MADQIEGQAALLLRAVTTLLPRFTYRFGDEFALHKGMAQVMAEAGLEFEHERVAGPKDRFDFYLPPGIVIEAKVKGSLPPALAQCARYAARDDVLAVVLVTTRQWGRTRALKADADLHGKPFRIVTLRGASF